MSKVENQETDSCASGHCLITNPRTLYFMVPFLAILALEQWIANSDTCMNGIICQMCVMSKTAVAALAGVIGLGLSRMRKKA